MRKGIPLLLMLGLLVAACSEEPTTTTAVPPTTTAPPATSTTFAAGPTPVVVDYSPTVSDIGGLMYLLAHPDIEVLAVSLPVTGEAECDPGVKLTLGILALMDREHVPVACDPDRPPNAEAWPAEFLEGQIKMLSGIPHPLAQEGGPTGTELIISAVSASDRPVTVWAVGPLTNVARALERAPEIARNIQEIVIMGGAVDVPGNVFGSPAEWNIFIDALAAAEVVSSGIPITLVALDATNDVPVPGWLPLALERVVQSDEVVYLARLVNAFKTSTSGFYFMWDELAAAVVADTVDVSTEAVNLTVAVGGSNNGQTARDDDGSMVTLATGVVSPDAFYSDFISVLAGSPFEKGQATAEEEEYLEAVAASLEEFGEALAASFGPGSPLGSDEFDGGAIAELLASVFDGLTVTRDAVEELDPPASFADLHTAYLEEASSDLALRAAMLDGLRSATSWEEAFGLFGAFSNGSACEAVATEAFFLGVDAEFPCNP